MSIDCSMPICEDEVHAQGLCKKHYMRWLRHGNPYVERKPKCEVCMRAARILRRKTHSRKDVQEKFTDLYLLHQTGSAYRLTNYDNRGREYDLEEDLVHD